MLAQTTSGSKSSRRVRIERKPDGAMVLHVTITEPRVRSAAKVTTFRYLVGVLEADEGMGFHLEKIDAEPGDADSNYDVNLDVEHGLHSCECKGFLRHGHCKHVESLLALLLANKLTTEPVPAADGMCERCGRWLPPGEDCCFRCRDF